MERAQVGLVVKPKNNRAQQVARDLVAHLNRNNISFFVDTEGSSVFSRTLVRPEQVVPRRQIIDQVEVVVTLGGDGTFISVARFASANSAKIIGVNVGTLGFLTEIVPEELNSILERTLKGEVQVDRRPLLESRLVTRTGETKEYTAINDIVIAKGTLARIFGVSLQVDGIEAGHIRGDGVIISSPSGSTAYSLAAGGSIVHPKVEALLVTPICPHSLTSRPLIVPPTSIIKLRLDPSISGSKEEIYLTVDGQEGLKVRGGDEIQVATSHRYAQSVASPSRGYFQALSAKLKWATHQVRAS